MSNYNLTDNVKDSFEFELRGKKYTMRYPKTEEVQTVQKLTQELNAATEKTPVDEAEVKAINQKLEDNLYGYITPVDHDTPVKDALEKENIKVLGNFNKMIQTELSLN